MRKVRIRKVIALLLAAVMAFSLVIVAGATEVTDTPARQTVTLNVTCTVEGDIATFTIKLDASQCDGVAALQFTLTPENMTQVAGGVSWPEATELTSVFNLNSIIEKEKGSYSYTKEESSDTGKFIAFGGDATKEGRYLSGTTTLLTIQYQLNADAESGTLKVSDFKACKSGDQALNPATAYNCTAPESVTATRPTTPTPPTPSTLKGDVNGDNVVDSTDIVYLARYLAGWPGYTIDSVEVADFDNSGAIDSTDIVYFARYLAGWPGYTID